MPDVALTREYERARDAHLRAVDELVPLVERMALATVAELLPGAHRLEVYGEINEDWIPILRIQRVLDASGDLVFDIATGHDDRSVEEGIDTVNIEYLDVLMDLTGDDFMGPGTIEAAPIHS